MNRFRALTISPAQDAEVYNLMPPVSPLTTRVDRLPRDHGENVFYPVRASTAEDEDVNSE